MPPVDGVCLYVRVGYFLRGEKTTYLSPYQSSPKTA